MNKVHKIAAGAVITLFVILPVIPAHALTTGCVDDGGNVNSPLPNGTCPAGTQYVQNGVGTTQNTSNSQVGNSGPNCTNCNLPYAPLEPILPDNKAPLTDYSALPTYLNFLFKAIIAIAAIVAVGRIGYSGFVYMFTSVSSKKTDALKTIMSAVWGLVLLLGVVTILTTINPQLTNFDLQSLVNLAGGAGGGNSQPTANTYDPATQQAINAYDPANYNCSSGGCSN